MREKAPRIANQYRTYFSNEYINFARRNKRVSIVQLRGIWYVDIWYHNGPRVLKTGGFPAHQHAEAVTYAHQIAQELHP